MELVNLPSGSIDLVHDSISLSMQFNCSCDDALPFCKAQCCRLRSLYGVPIESDEVHKFKTDVHGDLVILQKKVDDSCTYLENDRCSVHVDKPKNCSNWHCSPGGVGEGITVRANGWILLKRE
jgi:hypothetical protein